MAEKLQSESFSYEDAGSIVKVFNTIVQNVTHGNVSFPVLAAVSIDGRTLNAGFKQFAPRYLFDRELSKTSYFEKPVIFDAETAKKRSPQEYFQSASLGLGSLQLPDIFLDNKNRQRLLRPVQTPDQIVINVLRKFHAVLLESFEPAGDLVILMRLVQAQQ